MDRTSDVPAWRPCEYVYLRASAAISSRMSRSHRHHQRVETSHRLETLGSRFKRQTASTKFTSLCAYAAGAVCINPPFNRCPGKLQMCWVQKPHRLQQYQQHNQRCPTHKFQSILLGKNLQSPFDEIIFAVHVRNPNSHLKVQA